MNWIKRTLFFILLLALLMLGAATFITWKYSDDLKAFAVQSIRDVMITETEFNEDVVVSVWSDFPLVAVEISDIRITDSFGTDTLLMLDKGFVQFDLIKLIQNKITIEGIRATDGFIKLRRNAENEWNFRVWKQPERDDNAKTDFSIEVLVLENVHLDYDDRMIDLNIQYRSDKSKIKGRFTNDNQRLGLSLNGFMESLTTAGDQRIVGLPLQLAGLLNINNKDRIYTIETGNAILAGNEMVVNAEWKSIEGGTNMEMKVHAGNIEPAGLIPLVWPQMPENIKNLNIEGNSDIIFTLNGPFKLDAGPKLDATIRMRNGSLVFQNTNVTDLNFEGKLLMEDIKRSKAMRIVFDQFSLKTPSGNVEGSGSLTDLTNPTLKLKTKGRTRLEEFTRVAQIEDEMKASGDMSWNIEFSGPLGKDFNTTVNELKQMTWSGSISLQNSALDFNNGIPPLTDFSANVSMNQGKTAITQCSGNLGHLAFDGNIDIAQLKQILTDEKAAVNVVGNIHVKELNVSQLPEEWKFESESGSNSERAVQMQVQAAFDKVIYNDFTATNMSGNVNMNNNRVDITGLKFSALGGIIRSDLSYSPAASGYILDIDADLRNIDMSRTLKEWNEFGQKTITSSNLKSTANATLEADIYLDKNHNLIMDQLRVEADVEVGGGELIEFEPLLAMSKFIDVEELNRVQFDTLRNQLSIRNNKLVIPRMSVSSSILNVQVFGEHGFNQDMDYHVNLLLTDLLRRKQKKTKTFDGHEIIDEKGKTRLFLWIRGRPGDLKVGFDKREVKQKMKEDLKKEGQTIKQLFKEEFGGSKSDKNETEEESIQFKLEDNGVYQESERDNEKPTEEKPEPKKKKKKGLFSTEEEETETEGGFEIEFDP
ncbi:MAG: hypothetical protein H6602_11815 [Flavobacteriales bacterium]|nr:hypothetical protein [Flavobacteriales bacterium]